MPLLSRPAVPALDDQRLPWRQKILVILKSDTFINGIMLVAICVGFIHGWLKITFQNPVTTFLFDGLLLIALVFTYLKTRGQAPFFIRTPVGKALQAFYILCILYLFMPGGPPLIVSLAALRGWCFASLMYNLGFHLTKTTAQIKGYFYVLVILGVLTALYGKMQDPEEIRARMLRDPVFAERYKGIFYETSSKKLEIRRFSTFVSAGVFGGVMAFVSVFTTVLITDPREKKIERILLTAALVPICWGIALSGARSALIMLGVGFAVIAWHRRKFQTFIIIPAALLFALHYGMEQTEGSAGERFETLLDKETVLMRLLIPTRIGWESILDNPIGHGLGKSSYSVPFFLVGRTGYSNFKTADGDLGALMIEMGILGLIFFGRVLWTAAKTVYDILIKLRDSPIATVGLACAACIAISIMIFPIGSPFLGIPTGALTWFFLGTLQKLAADEIAATPARTGIKTDKRFLHYKPKSRP